MDRKFSIYLLLHTISIAFDIGDINNFNFFTYSFNFFTIPMFQFVNSEYQQNINTHNIFHQKMDQIFTLPTSKVPILRKMEMINYYISLWQTWLSSLSLFVHTSCNIDPVTQMETLKHDK